jgi:UDP-glucose 4-epimerase
VVLGDLNDEAAIGSLVAGADTVFHCAAEMGKGDRRLSHRTNVEGTERVALAAVRAGIRRFVYVSSISVYGATRRSNKTITEDIEPENTELLNPYSSTKYAGERIVRQLHQSDGLSFTIIRPTNVYGPHSKPWFLQFERLLRRVPIAIGELPVDMVYVDDLAEGMAQAAESSTGSNQAFNLSHEMVQLNHFMLEVAGVIGKRARTMPSWLDRMVREGVSKAYKGLKGKPLSMSLTEPTFYPHTKARNAFGYSPRIHLSEGMARLTQWVRSGRP